MSDGDNEVVRELTKLSTKMDMVCADISELKTMTRNFLERLTILEERVRSLEDWKDEVTKYDRLKERLKYDFRSAVAGGVAGGLVGVVGSYLIKLMWG